MAAMTSSTAKCFRSTSRPCRAAARPQRVLQPVQRVQTRDVRVAFFNLNKLRTDSSDAGIYGSQGREDFTTDDVEHYFNYMGMLAVDGSYDRMEKMLALGKNIMPRQYTVLMQTCSAFCEFFGQLSCHAMWSNCFVLHPGNCRLQCSVCARFGGMWQMRAMLKSEVTLD